MTLKGITLELLEMFKDFLPVYRKQQEELIAYRLAFTEFRQMSSDFSHYEYYADQLEAFLLRAQGSSALQHSTVLALVLMERTLDKWHQEVAETVSESEVSDILRSIKQGLRN